MPVGKYYCDYCDKQFQDTAAARRRHLQGVVHQRAKALWYDSVRNSSTSSGLNHFHDAQSAGKLGVCNHFVRTGSCQYGDSCKYYHPKTNIPEINTQGMEATSSVTSVQSRGIPAAMFGNKMGMSLGNLPPSLWPPPEGGYPPLPFINWG